MNCGIRVNGLKPIDIWVWYWRSAILMLSFLQKKWQSKSCLPVSKILCHGRCLHRSLSFESEGHWVFLWSLLWWQSVSLSMKFKVPILVSKFHRGSTLSSNFLQPLKTINASWDYWFKSWSHSRAASWNLFLLSSLSFSTLLKTDLPTHWNDLCCQLIYQEGRALRGNVQTPHTHPPRSGFNLSCKAVALLTTP